MDFASLTVQALNGLASASSLFLVASGLSLIFGVTRIVNFAHGSFFMLGLYLAYSLTDFLGARLGLAVSFWPSLLLASVVTGLLGALVEVLVLRRIYRASELFQLLATFALVLVLQDATLWLWGAEDLLGPRAPGLTGFVSLLDRRLPSYDLFLMAAGPLVLGLLWWFLKRTRFGLLIRAATQDREMVGALGVPQQWLFTGVFALGCALAGLGGALQLPREPAHLGLDLQTIGDAFVVVVVGGMGSIPGAYVAAVLIAQIKALCIGLGTVELLGVSFAFSKLTLVAEFLVMALVLVFKPWGLMGKPQTTVRTQYIEQPLSLNSRGQTALWVLCLGLLCALPQLASDSPYTVVLAVDVLVAVLFASSLHFILGPAGLHSFGHAAYFGVGAYAAALLLQRVALPMPLSLAMAPFVSALLAVLFGWFCVRLSGVYLAMLTLAFGQIVWSIVFQWDDLTGGSNGLTGIWPSEFWADKTLFFYGVLAVVGLSVFVLRRILHAPFGYALRASRDSELRAAALGLNVKQLQWLGFVVAAFFAGLGGALFAFAKGNMSPEVLGISRSVDGLVMVLLGGVQSLSGPVLGAVSFTLLQDSVARSTEYWRALLGGILLLLVIALPHGLTGLGLLNWRGIYVRCVSRLKSRLWPQRSDHA
jgi:branched-chain amino acid transport system permease protein